MASIEKFEDLEIWQLSRELVREVYKLTRKKEFSKDYGLKVELPKGS